LQPGQAALFAPMSKVRKRLPEAKPFDEYARAWA
jgi:hypothetical protein